MDGSYIYYPLAMLFIMLLCLFLLPLMFLLFIGLIGKAFTKIGLTPLQTWILLLASLIGSAVNIPVAEKKTYEAVDSIQLTRYFYIQPPPIRIERRVVIAVNLGGAIIPATFSFYLLYRVGPRPGILASLVIVTVMAYAFSKPVKGLGIVMPFYIAPLTAALASLLLAPHIAGISAYISGTLGTLIGADLLRLKDVEKIGSGLMSIGGAGVFDGIFLSGVLAVLLS
ncbi:MAG: DUF1614 domain-containing protein [Candidatus Korarchaeota archaeon]|nr:DUF1614 domain-containing protein [Candidatus Korarchaeota archaeon]